MKKNLLVLAAVAGVTLVGTGVGLASADTTSTSTNGTARSGVARYTIREERLNAVAEVLGVTPSQLEDTLKTETMKQAISNAGLTPSEFRQKVRAQLESDLLAKGYSQSQIDNTLSHHGKHNQKNNTSS